VMPLVGIRRVGRCEKCRGERLPPALLPYERLQQLARVGYRGLPTQFTQAFIFHSSPLAISVF